VDPPGQQRRAARSRLSVLPCNKFTTRYSLQITGPRVGKITAEEKNYRPPRPPSRRQIFAATGKSEERNQRRNIENKRGRESYDFTVRPCVSSVAMRQSGFVAIVCKVRLILTMPGDKDALNSVERLQQHFSYIVRIISTENNLAIHESYVPQLSLIMTSRFPANYR